MCQKLTYYGFLWQADEMERKEFTLFTRIDPSLHSFLISLDMKGVRLLQCSVEHRNLQFPRVLQKNVTQWTMGLINYKKLR